ncbi:MAG: hypothetical protein UX72_C0030G0005 [Parcubacteria group bacterium GW2011_GWA2_47_10]|nr:MAG: hypothetical protein UX72_C0030G0005 [Parcubacteria group bacterium GW2011_GWA2_47_10]
MADIVLVSVSFLSLGGVVYMISRKIPFLLAIPESIIDESFVTKPSKLKVFLERIRTYVLGRDYEEPILAFAEWLLRKIRIALLRFEHRSFAVLKFIQERRRHLKIPKDQRDYMESMKAEEDDIK